MSGFIKGGDVAAHASDTTTHGTTTAIVGVDDNQTLTNKTINTASNTITVNEADIGDLGTTIVLDSDIGSTVAAQSHTTDTNNPHSVTKSQVGLGNVQNILSKFDATTSPTVTDDSNAGYSVGSVWVDVTADESYTCVDSSVGAAVWENTSGASVWGSITGTLSNQTDLQSALDGKSSTSHNHDASYQPLDTDLTNIASLAGAAGFLKTDGATVWTVDTNTYSTTSHDHSGVYEPANANIQNHIASTSNPHSVTATQVGLGNVDNTSDANKPISTATQTALDAKQSFTEATVSTTDATPTTLVDIAIATDTRKQIKVYANGFETATGDTIWKEITLGCKNIAGTVSIIGSPVANTGYDAGASAWTIIASVSTTNIRITVTGENAHSIDWAARIEVR